MRHEMKMKSKCIARIDTIQATRIPNVSEIGSVVVANEFNSMLCTIVHFSLVYPLLFNEPNVWSVFRSSLIYQDTRLGLEEEYIL